MEPRRLVKAKSRRDQACFRCWDRIKAGTVYYKEYRPEHPQGFFRGLQFCRLCFEEIGQALLKFEYGMSDSRRRARLIARLKAKQQELRF
ncbi:MAG: hypothetical protein JSU73_10905 [candidate division WOR-3 bacterium]|nr:MAG: hypothetical protein JSU73_10905 [candidate division WOR-3 bacterium]